MTNTIATTKLALDNALNNPLTLADGRKVELAQGINGRGAPVYIITLTRADGRLDSTDHRFDTATEALSWWNQYKLGNF